MFKKRIKKSVNPNLTKGDCWFQLWSTKGVFALAAIASAYWLS